MYTLGQLIGRFISEMDGLGGQPALRVLGESHRYTLKRLAKESIGSIVASQLRKQDVIEFCKERIKTVQPATVAQDIVYLTGVLKYAPSAWDECEDISDSAIAAARPMLVKYQLIGKSAPRKRVPTDEEIARLLAYFSVNPRRGKAREIRMTDVIAFALASTRRIGEICRLTHSDIDWDRKSEDGKANPMYMVRDLKHPTKKKGNHKWFPLFPELAEIILRQPRVDGDDRVFPFNTKSCCAAYIVAKHRLGIVDLHFHDNRREAITRWLKLLPPHKVKLISGHVTTHILERVYDAQNPQGLHAELAEMIKRQTPSTWFEDPTAWKEDHA